jgi:hypothetical protein
LPRSTHAERDDDPDALYGLPLEDFVRERDLLAARQRARGDAAAAAETRSLRKPALAAWAVNQAARRRPREIDLLLDAGHRLLEAQSAGAGGDPAGAARRRELVDELTREAREALGPRAREATLRQVAETLRTASITPDGRELLARGRLTEPLATTGWELLAERLPPEGARPRAARAGTTDDRALTRAAEALRDAQERRREAERAVRDAKRRVETARRRLEQESAGLDQRERELREADERVRKAKGELERRRRRA